ADAGFEVEQPGVTTLPEHRHTAANTGDGCGGHTGGGCACGTSATPETAEAAPETEGTRTAAADAAEEPASQPAMAASPTSGGAATVPGDGGIPGQDARTDLVAVRRRGAGTELPPNA